MGRFVYWDVPYTVAYSVPIEYTEKLNKPFKFQPLLSLPASWSVVKPANKEVLLHLHKSGMALDATFLRREEIETMEHLLHGFINYLQKYGI